jgi:hypothetical protein
MVGLLWDLKLLTFYISNNNIDVETSPVSSRCSSSSHWQRQQQNDNWLLAHTDAPGICLSVSKLDPAAFGMILTAC